MLAGIIAGVTWALETIIISMAMCMGPLNLTTAQGILVGT